MGCFSREWYDISIGVSILTATSFGNVFFSKSRVTFDEGASISRRAGPRTDQTLSSSITDIGEARELVLSKSSEWVVDGRKCQGRLFRKRFRKKAKKRERKEKKMMRGRK